MKTIHHTGLRSALLWVSTLGAASCLTLVATAQSNDNSAQPAPANPAADAGTPAINPGQTNTANPIPDTAAAGSASTQTVTTQTTTLPAAPASQAAANVNANPAPAYANGQAAANSPPPPDAITPGSGGQYYNVTPVSTESIGTQQARFSGTANAPMTSVTTTQVGVLDATSPVVRPGMSPGQYGVAIALHEIAVTHSPDQVLAADQIAPEFRNAPYESHAAFGVYSQRVDAAASALDNLQSRAVQFSGDTQIPFRTAANNVRDCRADLDRCLTAAQNATPDNWDQVRGALADSYVRYSQAVTQATVAASR